MGGRDAEGDPGAADLPLRADEALRHRRLCDEERMCDLGGREAADLAERQRDAAVRGERRVTAREDEREALVGDRAHVVLLGRQFLQPPDELGFPLEDLLATDPVDRAVAGSRDDPGSRSTRHAFSGPPLDRGRERVLHGVLGKFEVAEDAREYAHGTAPLLPEDALDVLLHAAPIAARDGSRSRPLPSRRG